MCTALVTKHSLQVKGRYVFSGEAVEWDSSLTLQQLAQSRVECRGEWQEDWSDVFQGSTQTVNTPPLLHAEHNYTRVDTPKRQHMYTNLTAQEMVAFLCGETESLWGKDSHIPTFRDLWKWPAP